MSALANHAMLVVWGHFGQRIGLVRKMEEIPIDQRPRDHTPQTKLMEILVSTLGGCACLQGILFAVFFACR